MEKEDGEDAKERKVEGKNPKTYSARAFAKISTTLKKTFPFTYLAT